MELVSCHCQNFKETRNIFSLSATEDRGCDTVLDFWTLAHFNNYNYHAAVVEMRFAKGSFMSRTEPLLDGTELKPGFLGEKSASNALNYVTIYRTESTLRQKKVRKCIQKFPDWPPGARTVNATALCH
jgi:hypothetical protein